MRIESKLCHSSENKAIVLVEAWDNDRTLGSALGEGSTAESAEDNAISRLYKRINYKKSNVDSINKSIKLITEKDKSINSIEQNDNLENNLENDVPNDWSKELSEIDYEMNRLQWSREDELNFLKKEFGYNNRNKITKYSEIINYLNILKNISKVKDEGGDKLKIDTIIKESDNILNLLSWDHNKGREFLKKEFNVSSRKELNKDQLIAFVNKLKDISNESTSKEE